MSGAPKYRHRQRTDIPESTIPESRSIGQRAAGAWFERYTYRCRDEQASTGCYSNSNTGNGWLHTDDVAKKKQKRLRSQAVRDRSRRPTETPRTVPEDEAVTTKE
jgi:hypothetical protein